VRFAEHRGGALRGNRFVVEEPHVHGHRHGAWRDIRAMLQGSALGAGAKTHALAIFALLAEAEGAVHGIAADEVGFHEVGAWDSIVDIVAAGYLIDDLSPRTWTWSPLPLGSGRVNTRHGILPVPAPATALLMRGMATIDDGVPGERVTPTGAAILRHLAGLAGEGVPGAARLAATGIGFGTREMHGLPNILRCIAYEDAGAAAQLDETITTIQFEIDDQSAEDLGVALDAVRAVPGVLELYQVPVVAKKGRLATQVQVLLRPDAIDAVARACFEQTTTLGLRISEQRRRALAREEVAAGGVRVKLARRPSGKRTAKAESDDLAKVAGGRAARDSARRAAEDAALKGEERDAGTQRD
jgi:uncharacterized protein (TIGR00299 family) protein